MDNPSARRLGLAARARYGLAEHGPAPLFALMAILADGAAGVALHFGAISLALHRDFSLFSAALVVWASIQAIRRNMDAPPVRRTALLLLSLTFSQLLLGVGSYMNLLAAGTLEWFLVAHAVMAVAVFAAAAVLAISVYRRVRPEDAELSNAGVAIA
jgi:heme A synthase